MTSDDKAPIVLIHGLWMTPKSWDTWAGRFRAAGHEVIVPGWPGIDARTVEEVRRDPTPLKGIGITQIADHYDRIISALPSPPLIMGHSFGGLFTALLADRGLGRACVALAPAATAGVNKTPFSTLRSALPILANPLGKNGAKPISKRHFHYTFGNDLSRRESDRLWEEYAVNSYNRVMFEEVASAKDVEKGVTRVDYTRPDRAPLLVICGGIDHVTPPELGRATVATYERAGGPALVEYREYAGRTHRLVSQAGWEEIADFALEWAEAHATDTTAP
ncbi:alpha/beta hydrolase [Nocardioides mangrovi]|uniref:Alpha/beta hydrolase n=1 Tax=Nocardioides mangrovi TaxID=2874580 RepID=A0ABS7UH07_9ACTN|nr:alpha/beta hydrolase [Nocardioides mangrovi]MBZ5740321.1 alpha/beta hydrolase [Nocardioides mangrovi]